MADLQEANLSGASLERTDYDAFFTAINQGINLVALPLMLTRTLTARDMLKLTDATLIIRYNRTSTSRDLPPDSQKMVF